MIGLLFPLPHEGEELLQSLEGKDRFEIGDLTCITGKLGGRSVVVAFVGMGMEAAAASTRLLLEYFRLKAIILAGYGGALAPQLKKGQVVLSSNYTTEDVVGFMRFMSGFDFALFYSADGVLTSPEHKASYAEATKCQVVDMESAAVAEVAKTKNIPFIAIRGISDEATETLPLALSYGYDQAMQRMTPFRLIWYLLRHKHEISDFKKFVVELAPVRRNITKFIHELNNELPRNW